MEINTLVKGTIIADGRFLGNCQNVETLLSVYFSSLKTAIYGEGLELYELGKERFLNNWGGSEKESQIRKDFTLILTKKLSKNSVYEIINQVQSQPLKFIKN